VKDLSLHLMDIAQNSTTAHATIIQIILSITGSPKQLMMTLTDNGCGMDSDFLVRVTDPFTTTRTTRNVGLGIPLLKLSSELAGGDFTILSEKGKGTTITASFLVNSIDRIPLGDMPETISSLMTAWTDIEWIVHLECGENIFHITTSDIKDVLGDVPLNNPAVYGWLNGTLQEAIMTVFGGNLDEIIEGSGSHS